MYNFKITAAVREYFNYRYDEASFQLEEAKLNGLRLPMERDFRARREKQEDNPGVPLTAKLASARPQDLADVDALPKAEEALRKTEDA